MALRRGEQLRADRQEELAAHPTVKPVALVADAIKDVTRRGAIILDLFGGVFSIACLGLNILFGMAGSLSLGHATYFGVAAYTGAFLYRFYSVES